MPSTVSPTLQEIISHLENGTLEEREASSQKLSEIGKEGFSVTDGIFALKAAAKTFPPRKSKYADSSSDLIRTAARQPRSEYIPVISELFPRYSDNGKREALNLLASIEDRNAAVAYMNIVQTYARTGAVPTLPTQPLRSKPRYPDIFFPTILDYADNQAFEWDIYHLTLDYFNAGLLSSDSLLPYSKAILKSYATYRDRLKPLQQSEGIEWMWEDKYQKSREIAALILDLLGFLPGTEVQSELRESLNFADPRLRCFGVLSLARQGIPVDQNSILYVAKSSEMRNTLYDELSKMNKTYLFPNEFRTQAAFAESNMVNWLVFPTELARVPDEIEL